MAFVPEVKARERAYNIITEVKAVDDELYRYNTTVKDLIKVLSGLPPDAKISVCGGHICSIRISDNYSIVNLENKTQV